MTAAALKAVPAAENTRPRLEGPDFFCVGLQKGGTQWLYDQLQHHPDFWMPPFKELHYFDRRFPDGKIGPAARNFLANPKRVAAKREMRGDRSVDDRDHDFYRLVVDFKSRKNDLDGYSQLFSPKGDRLSGDITPGYSMLGNLMVKRISKRFPQSKSIMMLREPVSRLWSQWRMQMERKEATEEQELDLKAFKLFANRRQVMLRSYPSKISARWSKHFGSRFRYFFLDDVIARPDETRGEILTFLGGDPSVPPFLAADFNRKAKVKAPQRTPEIQAFMRRLFEKERVACAKMFGGPAANWPDAPY